MTKDELLKAALDAVNERIKPAKLKNVRHNQAILLAESFRANNGQAATAFDEVVKSFTDAVYRLVGVGDQSLLWDVEPAALNKFRGEKQQPAWAASNEREKLAREQEAKDAQTKAEDEAKTQTEAIISSYSPVDGRRGVVAYGKKSQWEETARKYVAKFRQQGYTWQAIAQWANKELDAQYQRDESVAARM